MVWHSSCLPSLASSGKHRHPTSAAQLPDGPAVRQDATVWRHRRSPSCQHQHPARTAQLPGALLCSKKQWCHALGIHLRFCVSTSIQQAVHNCLMAPLCSKMQRGGAIIGRCFSVSTGIQQAVHKCQMAPLCGTITGRLLLVSTNI